MRYDYSMTSHGAEKSAVLSWVLQPLLGQVATYGLNKETTQVNILQLFIGPTTQIVERTHSGQVLGT